MTPRSEWVPRASTTERSWRRRPGRRSNPAWNLPTARRRPRISINSGYRTQGPQGPLHQLSRHYRKIANAQLLDSQHKCTHAGGEAAIAEAVAAVHPAEAQQIDLDEHHGVHDRPTRRLSSLYMSMEPQSIRDMASMSGVGLVRYP